MSEFFRTATYTKNISTAERILRLTAAVGVGVAVMAYFTEPWMRWAATGTGVVFALAGVLGFCPACYMAGRKLNKQAVS